MFESPHSAKCLQERDLEGGTAWDLAQDNNHTQKRSFSRCLAFFLDLKNCTTLGFLLFLEDRLLLS